MPHSTDGVAPHNNDNNNSDNNSDQSTTTTVVPTTTTTTPPSSRRNKKPNPSTAPPKRTTIPLADGWTLISTTKSGRGHKNKNNKKHTRGSLLSPATLAATHTPSGPARTMPGTDKARLMSRLDAFRTRWTECACREGIRRVVASSDASRQIRKAVCVGLGSLSVDNAAAGVRSMWQLVCFLDVVEALKEAGEMEVYAEDPVFNGLDEEVLAEVGVSVVRGDGRRGGAARFIGRDAFVFAPFMPSFMVLEDFLAGRDPVIYVGNDVQATLELARSQVRYSDDVDERTRRCIRVAEEFLAQGREVAVLPEFDLHEHALAGQMIYWRKAAEE